MTSQEAMNDQQLEKEIEQTDFGRYIRQNYKDDLAKQKISELANLVKRHQEEAVRNLVAEYDKWLEKQGYDDDFDRGLMRAGRKIHSLENQLNQQNNDK